MNTSRLLTLQPLGRVEELEERLRDTTAALQQCSFFLNSTRLLLRDEAARERAADAVLVAEAVIGRRGLRRAAR